MKSKSTVDTHLERDPRYVAAKDRLVELQLELSRAEKERADLQEGISSLAQRAADRLAAEAQALLSGTQAPDSKMRQELMESLGEVDHRLAVLRSAIEMQRRNVGELASEVSRAICADLLPAHTANVRAVIEAARSLADACRAEAALREELIENGVAFSGTLRPMPIRGFDLRDSNGLLARLFLEAVEFEFMTASELPASLRKYVPPRAA